MKKLGTFMAGLNARRCASPAASSRRGSVSLTYVYRRRVTSRLLQPQLLQSSDAYMCLSDLRERGRGAVQNFNIIIRTVPLRN